jgi:hypothetical protein
MSFNVKIFKQDTITIYHFNIIMWDIYTDILDITRLNLWNKYSRVKVKDLNEHNVIYSTSKQFTCFCIETGADLTRKRLNIGEHMH